MNIIIAQIIGVIALIITMISVHQTEKRKMLLLQILSNFAYFSQYICLSAWSGAAITSLAILRCVVFYYYDEKHKDKSIAILIAISLIMIICGILTYDGILSVIPVLIGLAYTYSMWQNNMKIFRIVSVIAPLCWIVYNVYVSAFVATIASIFEFTSAFFAVLRFDIDKKQ